MSSNYKIVKNGLWIADPEFPFIEKDGKGLWEQIKPGAYGTAFSLNSMMHEEREAVNTRNMTEEEMLNYLDTL